MLGKDGETIMKVLQKHRRLVCIAVGLFTVIALFVAIFLRIYWTEILFLEDVRLDSIFAETVKTVIYDVDMPDGRMESQDPSEIIPVLDTLKTAVFRRAAKPRNPVVWQGMVWIETDCHIYGLGIISGRFAVFIDSVNRYYECSAQRAFWLELFPIIVSYEKNMQS